MFFKFFKKIIQPTIKPPFHCWFFHEKHYLFEVFEITKIIVILWFSFFKELELTIPWFWNILKLELIVLYKFKLPHDIFLHLSFNSYRRSWKSTKELT
jgi:hypothetical protein